MTRRWSMPVAVGCCVLLAAAVSALAEDVTFKHRSDAESVAFSPNGRLLAVGCADREAYVWDIARRKRLAVLGAEHDHLVARRNPFDVADVEHGLVHAHPAGDRRAFSPDEHPAAVGQAAAVAVRIADRHGGDGSGCGGISCVLV